MDAALAHSITAADVEKGLATTPTRHDTEKASPTSPNTSVSDLPTSNTENPPLARTKTATSHRSTASTAAAAAVTRALSRLRTADSIPLTPPPDGGVTAWLMTTMACLVNFNTWGFANTFGVFQTYYVNQMEIGTPSAVSWIGSLHIFLVFGLGTLSGRATDAGYFHVTFWCGSAIYCVGLLGLSFCTQYWQVFLCHSLVVGTGAGMAFVPSLTVAASYFSHAKRSIALALVVCGSSTGGLIFPAIAEQMLPRYGFGWTLRTIFFVQVTLAVVASCLLRPRLPPRKTGPLVEWCALKERPYALYLCSTFFMFLAIYVAFFYLGSFGRDVVGVSQATSIQLLLVLNGVGIGARVLSNVAAEKLTGPLNLIIPYTLGTSVVFFSWLAVDSESTLWIWAVFQGLISAGIQALFPVVLTSLTDDPKKMGVRSGMGFSTAGLAVLIGPPIAGALLEAMDGDYMGLQIFGGAVLALASGFQLAARFAKVGCAWKVKI